jgi:hypothetical protein
MQGLQTGYILIMRAAIQADAMEAKTETTSAL